MNILLKYPTALYISKHVPPIKSSVTDCGDTRKLKVANVMAQHCTWSANRDHYFCNYTRLPRDCRLP